MRPIFVLCGIVSGGLLLSAVVHPVWLRDGQMWIKSVLHNEASTVSAVEVESRVASQLFYERKSDAGAKLQNDGELHEWLTRKVVKDGVSDLTQLVKEVQETQPRYLRVSAYAAQSPSVDGLLEQMAQWGGESDKSLTHQAIVARARPAHLGFECVVLAGERLPDFTPEAMTSANDGFYSVCGICGHGQLCRIPVRNRCVSLECPECHHIYAMLAVDLHGRFHYMNEYLTGWHPVAHFPPNLGRYREMCLIWKRVVTSIRYVSDATPTEPDADTWQFAPETMRMGQGDCEDSAILLADWLISRGFEARVAVGRFGETGGHAWVIVRLEGKSYLLEATNPNVTTTVPPLAHDVGSRYVPEITFDPKALYLPVDATIPWDGDYWSTKKWHRLEPRIRERGAPVIAEAVHPSAPESRR